MTFLRLLSQEGHQNFTYTCINSAAWYNSNSNNFKSAVKLLGENEEEIAYENPSLSPNVLSDGCRVSIIINHYSIINYLINKYYIIV